MIHFAHPEAFLLAIPLALTYRWLFAAKPLVRVLRVLVLAFLLATLAEPFRRGAESGRDLILVVDRSLSVGDVESTVADWADRAKRNREAGDRIGVVTFGTEAVVEVPPRADFAHSAPVRQVDRNATDIGRGLDAALASVPPDRNASFLLFSDGVNTGRDPLPSAREALRRGIRIDVIPVLRAQSFDLAVEEIGLPSALGPNEPFQFAAWVRADRAIEAPYRLLRDGVVIAEGRREFRAGINRLSFRDAIQETGVHRYELEVSMEGDARHENDKARAVTVVGASKRVLVITPGGREDRLTRSLRAAGIEVDVASTSSVDLSQAGLSATRAIILENVPAREIGKQGMEAIANFVRDLGGGLWMTGGRASFGAGGYYHSPIEDVLPVSLEIRQEQRKFSLSMAIALDRSGSMAVTVSSGEVKMDLANAGAATAVGLLSPMDSISIIAVDSAAHVVVPSQAVDDPSEIQSRIRSIESMGGGIFVGAALDACAEQLSNSPQKTRHIVLFADANDSEEPGDYQTFVPKLRSAGVTVSVIGLGKETDSDAALLIEIAKLGGGRCFFVDDAAELPRVFAEETIQVAKSAFVEQDTAITMLPEVLAMADLADLELPSVGGYSIAYPKPRCEIGALTIDEQESPMLAFHSIGLGRAAAFLGEIDGETSGGLTNYARYGDFVTTVTRWITGNEAPAELFTELKREGHEGVVRVEAEAGAEELLAEVAARVVIPSGDSLDLRLERVGERVLEARFPMRDDGVYQAALGVTTGGTLRTPPLTLPYSPEFEPELDPDGGKKLLERIAETSDGKLSPLEHELFAGERESAGVQSLARPSALLALLLFLAEIAVRRLQLTLPTFRRRVPAAATGPATGPATESLGSTSSHPKKGSPLPSSTAPALSKSEPSGSAKQGSESPASTTDATDDSLADALQRMKKRRR